MPRKDFNKQDYQDDSLDLFRKILNGVQLSDIKSFDELSGQDRVDFLRYASTVVSSPWFEKVFSSLYFPHIMHAATQAENYDVVTFNRATGNGVKLVQEFFSKYNRKYINEFESEVEKPDGNKSFNSVT